MRVQQLDLLILGKIPGKLAGSRDQRRVICERPLRCQAVKESGRLLEQRAEQRGGWLTRQGIEVADQRKRAAGERRQRGVDLELDGDLLRFEQGKALRAPSLTELAARSLAPRLGMSHAEIRRDLELGTKPGFEASPLHAAVFALVERGQRRPAPRAVLPEIVLDTAKTTRQLTSASLARRAAERYRSCLKRL